MKFFFWGEPLIKEYQNFYMKNLKENFKQNFKKIFKKTKTLRRKLFKRLLICLEQNALYSLGSSSLRFGRPRTQSKAGIQVSN